MDTPTTRLAPSPTGAMHLGNARTFLINWAIARGQGHRLLLRIEDLDGPRVKEGASEQAIEDLRWLGIDWEGGPLYQRSDLAPYRDALARLKQQGLVYPCTCTRSEVVAVQSAPHGDDHELRYPGTCRPGAGVSGTGGGGARGIGGGGGGGGVALATDAAAWRVVVPDEVVQFTDQLCGPQRVDVQQQVGDFVVATKAGLPAYQLAVVVDDARQGVTEVIRGDDLIRSTGRQLWLYRMLDLTPVPQYIHVPLVLGPDGRRLAKRHGDTKLATYRQQGVRSERVIGLIARWCGVVDHNEPMGASEFLNGFALTGLPRGPVTFTQKDHAWLLQG